mmetsp:Transcript_32687/g.98470  ORF Transcript_32687/g.98470 Transcript_32687/m.98470 type:complete len:89 (+) Transcript_32687:78-344(+)
MHVAHGAHAFRGCYFLPEGLPNPARSRLTTALYAEAVLRCAFAHSVRIFMLTTANSLAGMPAACCNISGNELKRNVWPKVSKSDARNQ